MWIESLIKLSKCLLFTCAVKGKGSLIKNEEADSYGWLEEIETPKEAQMYGVYYMGPQIVETTP